MQKIKDNLSGLVTSLIERIEAIKKETESILSNSKSYKKQAEINKEIIKRFATYECHDPMSYIFICTDYEYFYHGFEQNDLAKSAFDMLSNEAKISLKNLHFEFEDITTIVSSLTDALSYLEPSREKEPITYYYSQDLQNQLSNYNGMKK